METLSFTDKSIQYRLKKMSKNAYLRRSQAYLDLQTQVHQTVLEQNQDGSISFPSGLVDFVLENFAIDDIVDERHETGSEISLPWRNKPHEMRDYQSETVELLFPRWRGLANLATGLGKTLLAVYLIRKIKRKTLVVCPSKAIADQFHGILAEAFGDDRVGYFGDGKHKIRDITVGIAQSVTLHSEEFKKHGLGLILFDEAHHTPATTFLSVAKSLGEVGRMYGLTATDFRNDGKDILIQACCGSTAIRRDVVWGVQNGWLAQPYFIVREVNTIGRDFRDDRLKNYKTHILECQTMKDRIRDDARRFLDAGKSLLILVDEIKHGEELAAQLGVPFAKSDDKKSQEYIQNYNKQKIKGLVATDGMMAEGVDTKPTEVLIIANFMSSKGMILQAIGRGLRKTDTKDKCIFLDYIPLGSEMLKRHAFNRIGYYQEITDNVKIITLS